MKRCPVYGSKAYTPSVNRIAKGMYIHGGKPPNPEEGDMYLDEPTMMMLIYDGVTWLQISR